MREIRTIVLHHSASRETTSPAQIRSWHLQRGYSDIGYHWIVWRPSPAGPVTVTQGRPLAAIGAHAKGHNGDSVGVCVAGNHSEDPIQPDMLRVTVRVLAGLCALHNLDASDVVGHRELRGASTECPGTSLQMDQIRDAVAQALR